MSETALYYTLSTISRTLAGALGMLAAFLALRVNALDAAIHSDLTELERSTGALVADHGPATGSVGERLEGWKKRYPNAAAERASINAQLIARADNVHASRTGLLRQTTSAFIASALVMGSCFIGLAATPWLGCTSLRGWAAALVATVSGTACLAWYGRIVRQALE